MKTSDLDRLWPRRRLGRSELRVPALAMGGAGVGGVYGEISDAEAIDAIHSALEIGVNFFDTDASYGQSERRFGLALEGVPRESFLLSTKCGTNPERPQDFSRDGTLWSVENSLKTLKTDYFDLLLVHDPRDMTPVLAPDGALVALAELKAQGVIRAIGLGQRKHAFHAQAIEAGAVDVILTFMDYNPIRTTADEYLLDLAAQNDVGILNGSPTAMGLLTGQNLDEKSPREGQERELEAAKRLYEWCRAKGVEETSVVLQFSLRQKRIHSTVLGPKSRAEVESSVRSALDPLPTSIWDDLAALGLTAGQEQPDEFCALEEADEVK